MTPYPFLQSNLDALQKKNPSVHRWLQDQLSTLGPSDRLVRNSRGLLDWMLPAGKSLFGSLLPWSVYKHWRIPEHAETGTTVIVGCNLGYGLNHLLPKAPGGHQVLVLEPRPDLLLACLGHTDYRPFLETGKLLFLAPHPDLVRDTLSKLIMPCLFGKIFLKCDIPSLQLGPEYALWTNRCKETLEDLRINVHTIRLKQEETILNEMRNLSKASRQASPAALGGKAGGITGVVLGAGPSLERFAPDLAQYREAALFTASLQVLPALQSFGLKPHFAMAIDPGSCMLKVYETLDAKWAAEIPLVYSMSISPEVIEKYPGPTIPIWTTGGLACHLPSGKEPVLDAGGSVGVALARFLRWCGVDRLLLVGQDFSWSGAKVHAGNHLADSREFQFDPLIHIKMKNRLDQTVFTAQSYLTSLGELERDLVRAPFPVFDLYGGGLPIRGSESIGPEDLPGKFFNGDEAAKVSKFMRIMKGNLSPAKPFWHGMSSGWRPFFKSVRRSLEGLMENPYPERQEVVPFLDDVLRHLQADPLRKPYLINEVIDLAGLMYKTKNFSSRELEKCKEIIGNAERKIQEMDRYLGKEEPQSPPSTIADVEFAGMAAS